MHFDLIQSLSLAGDAGTPNDDRAGAGHARAWVIDGATDLGPPGLMGARGGAAWLASAAHTAFTAAGDAPVAAMCETVATRVAEAYEAARTRDPLGRWELPMAAFLAARLAGDRLEAAWLGDCVGLLRSGDRIARLGPARAAKDAEAAQAAGMAEHGLGAVKRSPPILEALRTARSRPGIAVLGIEPEALRRLETAHMPCAPGDELLLMTDGFSALIDAYGAFDAVALMNGLAEQGLAALGVRLRGIEAADAACTRFPRFKVSDDATALWLRIGG
ncbi:protein phosphatase 2C domain-containing protein [Sphingosinicella sp. LHD-64]|uniref:protein phosphatase 2C domain-containing protein n=1 Tax=Sphingosinicella sp. LHD-64 TaxID=3072139 RepID=UPI00280E3B7F|nr:protein phosphatase 2C domain-containing protein [Sphingosinicella sp. LHD-64]MDQ8756724.1 protein phosphatase 2C domain-containing protein [Sphingosinicella sp. LHD-64]